MADVDKGQWHLVTLVWSCTSGVIKQMGTNWCFFSPQARWRDAAEGGCWRAADGHTGPTQAVRNVFFSSHAGKLKLHLASYLHYQWIEGLCIFWELLHTSTILICLLYLILGLNRLLNRVAEAGQISLMFPAMFGHLGALCSFTIQRSASICGGQGRSILNMCLERI